MEDRARAEIASVERFATTVVCGVRLFETRLGWA